MGCIVQNTKGPSNQKVRMILAKAKAVNQEQPQSKQASNSSENATKTVTQVTTMATKTNDQMEM